MFKRIFFPLVAMAACIGNTSVANAANTSSLTPTQINLLVSNVPLALEVAQAGGCPTPDYSQEEMASSLPIIQLRDMCPSSGTGLLANYVVDIQSGLIWSDVDRTMLVDSPRVQVLRNRFLVGPGADLNGDGKVDCSDVAVVKAAFGKKTGQSGYDVLADVNMDGAVDIKDLAFVSQQLPAGTKCP